jgi:hypothetical protein
MTREFTGVSLCMKEPISIGGLINWAKAIQIGAGAQGLSEVEVLIRKENKTLYLEATGAYTGTCPVCDGNPLETVIEGLPTMITSKFTCTKCGFVWMRSKLNLG